MRYIYLTLLLLGASEVVASSSLTDDSLAHVCRVQRRYYLIKRLERPTQLVSKIRRHDRGLPGIAVFDALWADFLSYKYVDDDNFDKEMITVVLLLYKHMLVSLLDRTDDIVALSARIDAYIATLQHRQPLYIEDFSLDALMQDLAQVPTEHTDCRGPLLHELLLGHTAWSDFYPQATQQVHTTVGTLVHVLDSPIDEPTRLIVANTMRLYHIQRMLKSLFVLSHYAQQPLVLSSKLSEKIRAPIVRNCVEQIEKTKSLLPLFQLWQRIICYDFINDMHEIKEFMHLVIIVYKNLTCCMQQAAARGNGQIPSNEQLEEILSLYDHISALEISELLDLLDDVATQLDHIGQVYELHNPDMSWTLWLKKYWWVIPVAAVWTYLTILKHVEYGQKIADFS